MKKRRPVIILALLLVLGLLLAALLLLTGGEKDEIDDPSVPKVAAESVSAMEWNDSGEEIRLEKKDGKWLFAKDESFPVDQLKAEKLAGVFASLTSTAHISADELGDEKDYGLHSPLRTLAAESESERITYEIGDESPLDSSRFYVRVNGADVYLLNRAIYDEFSLGLYDVIQTEEIPAFVNISSVKFETADSAAVYTKTDDGEGWLKNGIETDADSVNQLVKQLTDLEWARCVNYAPDADERAAYGTDAPVCTVTVKHENGDFVLHIGSDAGEYTFARLDGSDMVYLVDGAAAHAFISAGK